MRLSSLDDKCSASLAIEKMACRSVLKPEKLKKHNYKKMTLILEAHECRKHCKTQEKNQNTLARRMSSTEMCAKTMRLASNVYHMNAKNRHNMGSVSHPAGCLTTGGYQFLAKIPSRMCRIFFSEPGDKNVIYHDQWEFQDPKMEVYHIKPYFGADIPNNSPEKKVLYGRYLQSIGS